MLSKALHCIPLLILASWTSSCAGRQVGLVDTTGLYWATIRVETQLGCSVEIKFSHPKNNVEFCLVESLTETICPSEVSRSPPSRENYAGLLAGRNACDDLSPSQDLFPTRIYGSDQYFIPLLRSISLLLDRELVAPSEDFLALGEVVISELRNRRMSALSGLRGDDGDSNNERYVFFFPLRGDSTVLLKINYNGEDPEWLRLTP